MDSSATQPTCAQRARTTKTCPVRLVAQDSGLSIRKQGFDSPTGYSIRTWRSLVSHVVGGHEIVGSNPAVLTDNTGRGADGSTPALGAGGSRFDSGVPDLNGSRGLVVQTRLITALC